MTTLKIKQSDGTWKKAITLGSFDAAKRAETAATTAQNAASVAEAKATIATNAVATLPSNWQDIVKKTDSFVTPEMFGADGTPANDTIAIRQALSQGKPVIMTGIYNTNDEIIFGGRNNIDINAAGSTITYTGTGSAFVLQNINGGNIRFGKIMAENGNCIEYRCTGAWSNRVQYLSLWFNAIKANATTGSCILMNSNDGSWIGHNSIFGGEMLGGKYGLNIQNLANAQNPINGVFAYAIGFEGTTINVNLNTANTPITDIKIYDGRVHENQANSTIVKTNGTVSRFYYSSDGEIDLERLVFDNSNISFSKIDGAIYSNEQAIGTGYYKQSKQNSWHLERGIYSTSETAIKDSNNVTIGYIQIQTNYSAAVLALVSFKPPSTSGTLNYTLNSSLIPVYGRNLALISTDGKYCGRATINGSTGAITWNVEMANSTYMGSITYFV